MFRHELSKALFEIEELKDRLATAEAERDNALRYTELLIAERDALNKLADECSNEAQCAQAALLAAQAGEARAVEALEAEQRAAHWRNLARITDKHEDHIEATRLSEIAQNLRHGVVLVGNPSPFAWLAQQRAEAAAEELKGLFGHWESNDSYSETATGLWRCIEDRIKALEAAALRAGATGKEQEEDQCKS
jgi:hypothetical protein